MTGSDVLHGDSETPIPASEIGGHYIPVAAEVWIRQDQTRKIVEALRGREFAGNRTTGGTSGDSAASAIEREFGAEV